MFLIILLVKNKKPIIHIIQSILEFIKNKSINEVGNWIISPMQPHNEHKKPTPNLLIIINKLDKTISFVQPMKNFSIFFFQIKTLNVSWCLLLILESLSSWLWKQNCFEYNMSSVPFRLLNLSSLIQQFVWFHLGLNEQIR